MSRPPTLLLSDYAGHAFTYELAVSLGKAGWTTTYSYCRTTVTPKGRLDPRALRVIPVSSGRSFDKYNLPKRIGAEMRYGFGAAVATWRTRPDVHVVANMPLISLLVIWLMTLPRRPRIAIWFQDAQSGLATGILGDGALPKMLSMLEGFLLRRARRVIAISPELAAEAKGRGVRADRLGTIENWAPIDELPVRPRTNAWATDHDLDGRMVFLYSGTLARKHDPSLLESLARSVASLDAYVVVVSEGEGAEFLRRAVADDPRLTNLKVLPYQPFSALPDVLGSADVLLVLLEPMAGPFSVPSKTLSYLCAERPILACMPLDNTAAKIVSERARSGLVVGPRQRDEFCAAARALGSDAELRAKFGKSGRRYAETHFATHTIVASMASEFRKAMR